MWHTHVLTNYRDPLLTIGYCRYDQSFDVLVGPEKKRFSVYHDILTERSGFLKAARSSRWTEDPQKPTDLTDLDPEVFSHYLQLVYASKFVQPDAAVPKPSESGYQTAEEKAASAVEASHSRLKALVKLYVLADKLEDLTSANLIMDEFLAVHKKATKIVLSSLILRVYKHTPPSSPLRTVVRDIILFETGDDYYEGDGSKALPKELLFDVLREDSRIKHENRDNRKTISKLYDISIHGFGKCHYHQHHDGHPRCK